MGLFRSALLVLIPLSVGCASDWRATTSELSGNDVRLHVVGPDLAMDLTWNLGEAYQGRSGPRMYVEVGRCRVVADDDGLSRLAFPLAPRQPARPAADGRRHHPPKGRRMVRLD